MTTTSQIRSWYAPVCKARSDVSLIPAYQGLDACLKAHSYSPEQHHTGAFNCRPITGGTNFSLHAYDPGERFTFWSGVSVTSAVAVDINWLRNPYGPKLITDMPPAMVADVKKIRTKNGKQVWRWGGDYTGNKDAMHFEICCSPEDLNTGIDPSTLPGVVPTPTPIPTLPQEEEDVTTIMWFDGTAAYAVSGVVAKYISDTASVDLLKYLGCKEVNPVESKWYNTLHIVDGPFMNADSKRLEEWGAHLSNGIAAVGAKVGLPLDVNALAAKLGPLIKAGASKEEIAKAVVAEIAS